ncbi:MAG: hypothetical protein E7439_05410 [Ruminococcaceae bacterium]|nr:hypothetical protein [Oscillospiraceae bacterium]
MKTKILYALLALVVSFGLWLYVITVENPESEITVYNIPVILDNESVLAERGLMVLSDKVPTVTLKLSGNRSHLNKLNSSNITLVADMSRVYEAGEQPISYSIAYPGDIPRNSIEVLSQLPVQVALTVVERSSMDVPVNVTYRGEVDVEKFRREDPVLDYDTIHVSGPASLVNELEKAEIVVDLEGKTETISQAYRYVLYDKSGAVVDDDSLTVDVSEIKLTLKIQRFKELPVVFGNVNYGGGTSPENTHLAIRVPSITVAGSEQLLDSLHVITLEDIDLGMLNLSLGENVFQIPFADKLPDGVTNLSGLNEIEVVVTLSEKLVTKTVTITQFQTLNVPEGKYVNLQTKRLDVMLRGPADAIARITPEQIVASVDFTGAGTAAMPYKVDIQITDTDLVGIFGSYSVNAKLTDTPPA